MLYVESRTEESAGVDVEAVGDSRRDDWVDPERGDVLGPGGDLGFEVALDEDGDGVGRVADVGAEGLGFVVAGGAFEVHVQPGGADEGRTDFNGKGEVGAGARGEASPAGGGGEGGAVGVELERASAGERGAAEGGIGIGGIEGVAVEGEAGAGGDGRIGGDAVLVIEEDAGADAEAIAERVDVDGGAGGSVVEPSVDFEAVGGEVRGIVGEVVADGAELDVAIEVRGELQSGTEGGEFRTDGDFGEGPLDDIGGGGNAADDSAGGNTFREGGVGRADTGGGGGVSLGGRAIGRGG